MTDEESLRVLKGFRRGNTEAREMGLLRSWLGEGQSGNVILGTRELGEMESEE